MIRRQLINRHVIGRHCLGIGPFTWASMILCLLYISLNIFFMFYPGGLTLDKRRRCGILALSNMIILYASPSMSYLSDLMMIRLRTWRYIHRAAGWMMCAQTGGHIIFSLTSTESVSRGETAAISGIIASSSIVLILILSLPLVRRFCYPVFYVTHYFLALLVLITVWMHLPSSDKSSWSMVLAITTTFGASFVLEGLYMLYLNGACGERWSKKIIEKRVDSSIGIYLSPGRPVKVLPGQYVNLWFPSLNPWSWFQCSSFIVTSWSPKEQVLLHLFARCPSRSFGFTWMLLWRATIDSQRNITFFSGPHGLSVPAPRYETVLLIASDAGILAVKPYVDQLFHCVKKRTSKTRRLCLVWKWINGLFQDDIEGDTRIKMLQISIYDPKRLCRITPGQLGTRGQVYQDSANFDEILKKEVEEHHKRRTEDVREERGEMLVMVSASDTIRYDLQESVKAYSRWVRFVELDYQPS
ncbi:hypothetical protein BDV35DRAFT_383595 [Aspergillus flavus]|uniref:Ferric oxidoreductase domain-containing protein n=1 Tax=Aspergillus flavus TaxID=5059 RepID=A0A5N6GKS3_ASPFL|nr:hypothetical protein BDV35DRAFT_383595 [Aspergillus flavus]